MTEQIHKKAHQAAAILENPVFNESFEKLRSNLLAQFEAAETHDVHLMQETHMALRLLTLVKRDLSDLVASGYIDEMNNEQRRQRKIADEQGLL